MLRQVLLCVLCIAVVGTCVRGAATVLPEGNAPAALTFPHFPDRQHAFVWRNWGIVEPARLAAVLGTSEEDVTKLAASMGLPANDASSAEPALWRQRGYITLIRRNWHLLPYDQLLQLLDVNAERLTYLLREDDFLYVKLGNHKPGSDRLTYAPPDAKSAARAEEIRRVVQEHFATELARPADARFAFVKRFSEPVEESRPVEPSEKIRFAYSYFAVYGDPLSDPSLDPYPDGLLQALADRGVNGVWLHTVLRDLAPGGEAFPEFGAGHEKRLHNLRTLVARAKRFGIGVYLYVNEPRAMPPAFFKDRPEMAGVREGEFVSVCTSDPRVREWITRSLGHVFRTVPDLAGVFTITASENLTSCASHYGNAGCPRCRSRGAGDIVAEVNAAVATGVRAGNSNAKVVAWDWGWKDEWAAAAIEKLPKEVRLQSVSEWSIPLNRGGVATTIDEYCISQPGPGPRAARHWSLARAAGLKTSAKVQLNNTWELSAVPYLPVLDLVAEHCENLSRAGVDGMQLSWTLGGYPSPNLDLARRLTGDQPTTKEQALDALARERFGDAGAPHARRAWTGFSDAFRHYPYDGGVVYNCPAQYGPSNLLYLTPTRYAATMIGFPYDDLNGWRGPYPAETFAAQFEKVASGWDAALKDFAMAAEAATPGKDAGAKEDLLLARAAGLHFRSVANQARFVMARNAKDRDGMRRAASDELRVAKELFALARQDSRVGFEASNHYYYVPQDLIEKVINCQHVLDVVESQ